MPNFEFFIQRPAVTPTIYAYELIGVESHKNYIKVGFTDRTAEERIIEQLHTSGIPYRILGGTRFYDRKEIRDIVAYL